jgi:hypothetical protein
VDRSQRYVSQDPEKRARSLANLRPFVKGDPRAGRPKKPLSDALLAKLVRKKALAVAKALISKAEDGDVFAFKELADRTEGKVVQQIEVSGNVDLGLRIAAARQRRRLGSTNSDAVVTAQECDGDHPDNCPPMPRPADPDAG